MFRRDGECSKALLTSGLSTNGRELSDKELLLVYDTELFSGPASEVRPCFHP
jgi:hypothetical protein